jgi:hypothetical protein
VEEPPYFVDVDFRMDSSGHSKSLAPHVTKQVRLPQNGDVILRLKKHYDLVDFSFEGVSGQAPPECVDFDLPDYDDDDPYKSGEDPTESHDQGGAEPTVDAGAATSREEPYDYGTDSIGRKIPQGQIWVSDYSRQ